MKLRLIIIAWLVASAIGPSPSAAQELRVALGSAVTSADPHFTVLGSNSALARNVFDGLINQDDTQRLAPALAVSWRALDTTNWEFKLRDGVKFHDGSEFGAEDVAASIRRVATIKNSPNSFLPFVRPIKAVTIVDRLTLRIETTAPYPLLPAALSRIAIVPRGAELLGQEGFNAATQAHGTGAYKLVEFVPGERAVLRRNDAHWGGTPSWDRVVFRIVPNDSTRIATLLAGDVDVIENVPTSNAAKLAADARVRIARGQQSRDVHPSRQRSRAIAFRARPRRQSGAQSSARCRRTARDRDRDRSPGIGRTRDGRRRHRHRPARAARIFRPCAGDRGAQGRTR